MTDDFASAMDLALRRLRASDRFESEVRRSLERYSPETVDAVVARLRERRLLNEPRTAERVVERNAGRRAVGVGRLRDRLERRGAPADLIDRVVAEASPDDGDRARAILAAKYPDGAARDIPRAARLLAGRGFDEDTVREVISGYFGDDDAAPTGRTARDVFIE